MGEVNDDGFGGGVFGTGVGHIGRDFDGNGRDAVAVTMQQVVGVDVDAADLHWQVQIEQVHIAVRANQAVVKDGEANALDLLEVSARPVGNQTNGAKGLEGIAEYIAEVGGGADGIEILQDDHRWTGQVLEAANQIRQGRKVAFGRFGKGAAGRGRGETDHGRQIRECRLDLPGHKALIAAANGKQFNDIADGGGVELPQLVAIGIHQSFGSLPVHSNAGFWRARRAPASLRRTALGWA